ncbi:hypothetical protein H6775_03585 [Candidatus Nomurabacteria bacterium]|nr:hypothetical protein [Candidatus Nomurabacteria bacterium]
METILIVLIVLTLITLVVFGFLFVSYFSKNPPHTFFTNAPAEHFVLAGRSDGYEKGFIASGSGDLGFNLSPNGATQAPTLDNPQYPHTLLYKLFGWVWLSISPAMKVLSFEIDAVKLNNSETEGQGTTQMSSLDIRSSITSRRKTIWAIRRTFMRPQIVPAVELSEGSLDFLFRCEWECINPVLFALRYHVDLANVEDVLDNTVNDLFSHTLTPAEREKYPNYNVPRSIVEFREGIETFTASFFNNFIQERVNRVAGTYGLRLNRLFLKAYGVIPEQADLEAAQVEVRIAELKADAERRKAEGDRDAATERGIGEANAREELLRAEAEGLLARADAEGKGWKIVLEKLHEAGLSDLGHAMDQVVQDRRANAIGKNESGIVYSEGGSSSPIGIMVSRTKEQSHTQEQEGGES